MVKDVFTEVVTFILIMSVFKSLYNDSNDLDSFSNSLKENHQAICDCYRSTFDTLQQQSEDIYKFILFKRSILAGYQYTTVEERAFVMMLLDMCLQLSLTACIPHIIAIINNNDIKLNRKISAQLYSVYPTPSCNSELVDRFESICSDLEIAAREEEDDVGGIKAAFLNYYSSVLCNLPIDFARKIQDKAKECIVTHRYNWLCELEDIINQNIVDKDSVCEKIHVLCNALLNKVDKTPAPLTSNDQCIIEQDTNYSREILGYAPNVMNLRNVALQYANGELAGRGVKLLETEQEMCEYLKRFGKMHYAKLLSAFEDDFPQEFNEKIDLIDWGCGQALASITFIEKYGKECVNSITLIEPSEIVLRRAALHCNHFAPNVKIHTICKKLDDVNQTDFNIGDNIPIIHLFSNILDIDDYNFSHLIDLVERILSCENYFVCVSPYIDDIKSARLHSFMEHFSNYDSFKKYHNVENTKYGAYWACNNSFKRAFSGHGNHVGCYQYDAEGCAKKWTRVMKVFAV